MIDSLTLILPTLNEKANLEVLIPEFNSLLSKYFGDNFEILVIDDNSEDGTFEFIETLQSKFLNLEIILRSNKKSLPMSIFEGINFAKYANIMWLDADGSMGVEDAEKLILEKNKSKINTIVGSRFIENGGYKGSIENDSVFSSLKTLMHSEDSIIATFLSKYFNLLLSFLGKYPVKDMTSGFVLTEKRFVNNIEIFNNAIYGEYFVNLIFFHKKNNYTIKEVGYFCKTRLFGKSKTSYSFFRIIYLSFFYIKAALRY